MDGYIYEADRLWSSTLLHVSQLTTLTKKMVIELIKKIKARWRSGDI